MVTKETNSEMTSEAYNLLDCFVSGIDDIVYEIAESIAAGKGKRTEEGVVQIDAADVKAAAQLVFDAIKAQTGKSISNQVAAQIESMHSCVMEKCRAK